VGRHALSFRGGLLRPALDYMMWFGNRGCPRDQARGGLDEAGIKGGAHTANLRERRLLQSGVYSSPRGTECMPLICLTVS
jgi:hypothetical protein